MKIQLISAEQINEGVRSHLTLSEAAHKLGVAKSTIRRAARAMGVERIAGRTVRGGILIDAQPVPICITYSA